MVRLRLRHLQRGYPGGVHSRDVRGMVCLEADAESGGDRPIWKNLGGTWPILSSHYRSFVANFKKNSKNRKISLCILEKMGYNRKE